MSEHAIANLYGRIFIRGDIKAVTGLHIGGKPAALSIGTVDNPVIRDPLSDKPYIPGSSLRGKMRSLWEKATGASQNFDIGKGVKIHICTKKHAYEICPVCQIYGTPGNSDTSAPTRLVVRDIFLNDDSAKQLRKEAQTDMPYTEVKWEAAIDRVTSAATPRQIERVPAGALFSGLELVFSVYKEGDLSRFGHVLEAMQLLEDDYLGGVGSRGSGKVAFTDVTLALRSTRTGHYGQLVSYEEGQAFKVADLLSQFAEINEWLTDNLPLKEFVS